MKIEHLYYIEEIAQTGSINKAAESLMMKQPYLSAVLLEMERDLGVKLFTRHNWGVAVTPAGKDFLTAVKVINDGYQQIMNLRNHYNDQEAEKFTIANIYSYTLMDLFNDFVNLHEEHKHNIAYIETPPQSIIDSVYREKASIGFAVHGMIHDNEFQDTLQDKNLSYQFLCREPFYLIVNKSHPLSGRTSLTSEDMHPYTFVVDKHKKNYHRNNFGYWFDAGRVSPVLFDNNRSAMYYLIKNPDCFSVGQKSLNLTNPFVISGDLRYIRWEDSPYLLETGYITSKACPLPQLAKEFCHYVEAYFQRYEQKGEHLR